MTKRTARALDLPLTLETAPTPEQGLDAAAQVSDGVAPEIALGAAAVLVLKLVYGLDGRDRCACPFPRPLSGPEAGCSYYIVSSLLPNDP